MTEEEKLAEEYRKSLWQRLIDEDDFERLEMFDENVEEAYLAGLEAGKKIAIKEMTQNLGEAMNTWI